MASPMDDTIDGAIERFRLAVPARLKALPYWVLWRFEAAEQAGKKPLKVPYYAGSGQRRKGVQGTPEDVAQLATFEQVLQALRTGPWSGIGFAHVPGCGINSWDFDNVIDGDGVIASDVLDLIHEAGTYAEISPSGRGIRMIAAGNLPSIKRIKPGGMNVECFGETGFVTVTGRTLCGDDVVPLPAHILRTLQEWLQNDQAERPHNRLDQLAQARTNDPIYQHLKSAGAIKRDWPDGRSSIRCPFESEHTSGSGKSDTVYFLPHTNGYANGHFHCLHAHCAQRTDDEFRHAVGVPEVDLSRLLAKPADVEAPAVRTSIDWLAVAANPPKPRRWTIEHWLPIGTMTVLFGRGGLGKTLVMQQLGSKVVLAQDFLGKVEGGAVLQWCAEDDADELARRQFAIAQWCDVPIGLFANRLHIEALAGHECTLVELVGNQLKPTKHAVRLWEQINDLEVSAFFLDNIAHLYGGNENDRHQVTLFMNLLTGICLRADCAGVLAGHPSKGGDSEFSGSTAWENAVRSRLFLSRKPPDTKDDDGEQDSSVRYLAKRKANYSALDCVRLNYLDGVLQPDVDGLSGSPLIAGIKNRKAKQVVLDGVRKLKEMGVFGNHSHSTANYLPKILISYALHESLHVSEIERSMRELMKDGALRVERVGQYANRNPKYGLVIV